MALRANEIRTIGEFRSLATGSVGVIGITDNGTGNVIHHRTCRTISEDTFAQKVLVGGAKNGRYYFFLRAEDGARDLNARLCPICQR